MTEELRRTWDKLVDSGVMPCSFNALDKVRIEAGLLFYGYDMTIDHTPWEVGLGFTVSKSKSDFICISFIFYPALKRQ